METMSHVILQTTSDNASAITSGQSEECNLKIRQPVINPFAKVSKKYYNQHGLRVKKKLTSGIWFCIDIKGFEKSIYFKGQPIQLGIPAMEANAVIDTNVYIVPVGEPVFADDPQYKVQS